MDNPLQKRPKVIAIIVQPKTPDRVKNLMAQRAVELSSLGWWIRTGCEPEELEIAKAAGKRSIVCVMRDGREIPSTVNKICPENVGLPIIEKAMELFREIAEARFGGVDRISKKHWPRALEQLLVIAGSSLNYTTCSRAVMTYWEEKKLAWGDDEHWPLVAEAINFGRLSPQFPFSANIVNMARKTWEPSLEVEVPELRAKMPSFTLNEIGAMDTSDATNLPF